MRKRTPLAIAFLVAETLVSCGTDSNPNDGINEDAARESESRSTYGTGPDWKQQENDSTPVRAHDVPERLSTEGDNGK